MEVDDAGEMRPRRATLVFTPEDWDQSQTVQIEGVDDDVVDGDFEGQVLLTTSSTDTEYDGLRHGPIATVTEDDDTASLVVSATGPLSTDEDGRSDSFDVNLGSRPVGTVTLALAVSDDSEVRVSPTTLSFDGGSWFTAKRVTVTGVDDAAVDGDAPYTVTVSVQSADQDVPYQGLAAVSVDGSNGDGGDAAGLVIDAPAILSTSESGGASSFTVALASQPLGSVTLGILSGDAGEAAVSPASVLFDEDSWDTPVLVTVTGQDDVGIDGDVTFSVSVSVTAAPADPQYLALAGQTIEGSNADDDAASLVVSGADSLSVSEKGGVVSFEVSLSAPPSGEVVLGTTNSAPDEVLVTSATLRFDGTNWNQPQAVTLTGQPDDAFDGDQQVTVSVVTSSSQDIAFDALDSGAILVTVLDADPGVVVTPVSGLVTRESGAEDTFEVVLNTRPTHKVQLDLTSDDPGEGLVSDPVSGLLTFTPDNWNAPQVVTVRGVDDQEADGNTTYSIQIGDASSEDGVYNGMSVDNVEVQNFDDETAAILLDPSSGLQTSEGGAGDRFTVRLNSRPAGTVELSIVADDLTEVEVSPASHTFTQDNWDAPREVNLSGVDDAIADGNISFTIVVSVSGGSDPAYAVVPPVEASGVNVDDETAGFLLGAEELVTREDGLAGPQISLRLTSEPAESVTVSVEVDDATEASVDRSELVFTASNWDAPQRVTVTGVEDAVADGDQLFSVKFGPAASDDRDYAGLTVGVVSGRNVDNDSPGITVTDAGSMRTSEAGGEDTFEVRLNSQPTFDVVIGLSSSDSGEGTVSPASLTFTDENWNAPRTVTVTGADDFVADGDRIYVVITATAVSDDQGYHGRNADDPVVTNIDNESAGFIVSPTSGLVTSEAGGTAAFTVELSSEPTSNVSISLVVSDAGEGSVSPETLTFTPQNWNAARTVTVTGQDDDIADGDPDFQVDLTPASSADEDYDTLDPGYVTVTNEDNETPGVTIVQDGDLEVSEDGTQTARFSVQLSSRPFETVNIALQSTDPDEGTLDRTSLTFTDQDWNAPQVVTITGVDDSVIDGPQPFQITLEVTSTDGAYQAVTVEPVKVKCLDDETAAIRFSSSASLITNEAGTVTASLRVRLASQPSNTVQVSFALSDTSEGTLGALDSLSFDDGNWDQYQTLTVRGLDDDVADGNQSYTVGVASVTSSDGNYHGIGGPSVDATNLDDESVGVRIDAPGGSLVTSEAGGTASFDVVLESEPTGSVTLVFAYPADEGSLNTDTLVFDSTNWNQSVTVTVTGQDDSLQDGNQLYPITADARGSDDPDYAALGTFTVAEVVNVDDD